MKPLKTPLRYPGGKSKAIQKIAPFFPDMTTITEYREPFLGGGSMALYITKEYPHLPVWVNDVYEPLANFWQVLQNNPDDLVKMLLGIKRAKIPLGGMKPLFGLSKNVLGSQDNSPLQRAASFYLVNKCSFSGSTESGGFSKSAAEGRFTTSGIEKLPEYSRLIKNWKITNYDYTKLLTGGDTTFIYADPPYDINQGLYGKNGSTHRGFDHGLFAFHIKLSESKCLISYNSDQHIKDLFPKWNQHEFDHQYSMVSQGTYRDDQRARRELLLSNYGKIIL